MDEYDNSCTVFANFCPSDSMENHMYKNMIQGKTLTTIFDNLRKFSVRSDKTADKKATRKALFGYMEEDTLHELDYVHICNNFSQA